MPSASSAHVKPRQPLQTAPLAPVHAIPAPVDPSKAQGLKQLNFVPEAATTASVAVDNAYSSARTHVPATAEPYVAKAEETVTAYTAPVALKAAEVAEKIVASADEKVDHVAKAAAPAIANGQAHAASAAATAQATIESVVETGKAQLSALPETFTAAYATGVEYVATIPDVLATTFAAGKTHVEEVLEAGKTQLSNGASSLQELKESGVKHLTTASQRYLDLLRDRSVWVMDKLSPSKNVTRAKDTLHAAIEAVDQATEPDVAIGRVQAAWNTFAALPAVRTVLATAEPATKFGQSSFVKVHATLVGSSYYSKAVGLSGATLSWAASTTPYTLSAKYLYPLVRPVADPALGKITRSARLAEAVDYWKPAALAATPIKA